MALLTLENYEEDYLKNIEIEHFDESMSFMDCALYSIAEGERTWNDIMKEMAVEELISCIRKDGYELDAGSIVFVNDWNSPVSISDLTIE